MAKDVLSDLDHKGVSRVLNLPAPATPNEPARLADLQSAVEGLAWKDDARTYSSTNINLAAPGATIGGVTMAANDRWVAGGQTAQTENGIYIWNGAATPATRSADASTFDELEGAVITATEGTGAGTYRQTQVNGVIGTNNVLWAPFATDTPQATEATAGKAEIATQAETDAGTDDLRIVTPLKLSNWSGRARKYLIPAFGDGSATQFTITHNLNTRALLVSVYRNSGNFDEVFCDVEHTTVNTVTLRFASPPAASAFAGFIIA